MRAQKHLTRRNFKEFFFQYFKQGEYCTYDYDWFLFDTVKKLAAQAHIKIKYCPPRSDGYKKYGDAAFRVFPEITYYSEKEVVPVDDPKQVELMFDPKLLMN